MHLAIFIKITTQFKWFDKARFVYNLPKKKEKIYNLSPFLLFPASFCSFSRYVHASLSLSNPLLMFNESALRAFPKKKMKYLQLQHFYNFILDFMTSSKIFAISIVLQFHF